MGWRSKNTTRNSCGHNNPSRLGYRQSGAACQLDMVSPSLTSFLLWPAPKGGLLCFIGYPALAGKFDQLRIIGPYFQTIKFIRGRLLRAINAVQRSGKVRIRKILLAESAINIVATQVGQLNSVGESTVREHGVLN